ncbi:MAG: hypothetical protein GEU26_13220 [Nitrososphaeraceae archaeon]|nr:hypothetical protein [Nitrososphaeraceae archaeon]
MILRNTSLGNAIEQVVDKFYNLYSTQDDGLEFNRFFEGHDPLGLVGLSKYSTENWPRNYDETDVTNAIPPLSDADGDGNLEECFEEYNPMFVPDTQHGFGENHCGYIGFRQPFSNLLMDDGVVDVVLGDWTKS